MGTPVCNYFASLDCDVVETIDRYGTNGQQSLLIVDNNTLVLMGLQPTIFRSACSGDKSIIMIEIIGIYPM